jgi:molecular chaperone GrpE (heat shock protein)
MSDAPNAPEAAPAPEPAPADPQAEVSALKAKVEEAMDLARRARAEFLNYQDRVRRERQDWNRQALEGFIREILPALDGFSMATFSDPKLLEAVRMLEREFVRVFAKFQLVPIETAGKVFDPMFHEAIAMEQGGTELQEVRRGWMLDGKVLRPANVRLVKPAGP